MLNEGSRNLAYALLAALLGLGSGYLLWGRRASRRQEAIDALNQDLSDERPETIAGASFMQDEAPANDLPETSAELLDLKARVEYLLPLEARVCELTLALAIKDQELAAARAALAQSSPDQEPQRGGLRDHPEMSDSHAESSTAVAATQPLSFAAAAGAASISGQAPLADTPPRSIGPAVASAGSDFFEDESSNPETALPESPHEPDFLLFEPRRTRPSSILLSTKEAELRHLRETLELLLGPVEPEVVAPLAAQMRTGSDVEDWLLAERTARFERLERLRAERASAHPLY
jgi:hypothetical protein